MSCIVTAAGPTKHRNPRKHVIDSTNYHAKHSSLTLHNLRPELTRKGLRAHFYFGNDMVANKVTK